MSSGQLKCQECDQEFTVYKNFIRHVNTVHGNESRKNNEARKDRLIECTDIRTFEEPGVGCDHQVALKSPKEYVAMAMKINHHKQLTSDEFMQATELSVFKLITDTFWTALYKRPDLYVYITEEMLRWLGFEGESRTQKLHMTQTLNARSIHYIYLSIDDLRKIADQVLEIPSEAYVKPQQYRHLLMRPLDFQVLAASVQTKRGKEVASELVKLGFVVHCYREYELEVKEQENKVLQYQKQVLEYDNTNLQKCKADMTTNPMKDLTLKVIMFEDDKFAVIRGQRSHADVYQKKYMSQLRGPKKTVDFTKHPNAMSKWVKMRQLLSDHQKIQNIEGNLFKCVNDYDLSTLMKDLKMEHRQQCVMLVSGHTIDSYVKEKPLLHPDLADHTYCKVN